MSGKRLKYKRKPRAGSRKRKAPHRQSKAPAKGINIKPAAAPLASQNMLPAFPAVSTVIRRAVKKFGQVFGKIEVGSQTTGVALKFRYRRVVVSH